MGPEPPVQIVHLWTVDGGRAAPEGVLRERGFLSLVRLAQALGDQMVAGGFGAAPGEREIHLTAVSDHLFDITGEELPSPGKATVQGPVQVIPQEYPNVRCRLLDVILPDPGGAGWERLVARLEEDLAHPGTEPVVCYRGAERWIPSFDRVRLGSPAELPALRAGGRYLVTGGLGGIGLEVARRIAGAVQADLVLVGRSALPPRAEWDRRVAEGGALADRLRTLRAIEAAGSTLTVVQADVCDEAAMRRAVGEAGGRPGPVDGVFHAAGVAGGTLVQRQDPETAAAVLAPKVDGTLVLDRLLEETGPALLVLFSSQRAFLGGAGQVDYCAANGFLEAFARARSRRGRPTVAIAWDGWREIGMARRASDLAGTRDEDLEAGLSNDEGWDVLIRILATPGLTQVVVSARDFPERLARFRRSRAGTVLADALSGAGRPRAHPRPELTTPYVPPQTPAEELLVEVWGRLLGIEPVGVDDNFFELGGDSVVSLQIVSKANAAGLRLTPRQVFQHQTVAGLAAVAGSGTAVRANQDAVTGEVPLTPIQRRFLDAHPVEPRHFNQSVRLRCHERLDARR
ncbi:MAG TPA: SDR family NAD(P)-dependent oxidoreductase, partial [Thermoanaerobaculia bacterium]|nr:SDR family NAD(P)-dependent oxidoreductase [Thermoanaerobaculia bacterium]